LAAAAAARSVCAVPAFPGAEGFGAYSVGGRFGDVYHVTTLDPDVSHVIPGSLNYGLYAKNVPAAGRTIVFDVGGTIYCNTGTITFKDIHNITIAGQTAPGPGITIIGNTFGITGNDSTKPTHDINARDLTVRKGTGDGDDAMHVQGSGNTHDVILDHISGSWSEDEVISATQTATNVTVQNSIMSEALTSGHQYGSLIRPTVNSNVSYLRNLYSNQASRNPRPGTYDGMTLNFEFQNNVIYNWSDRAGYIAGADGDTQHLNMNYVGNYLIAGPSTVDAGSNTRRSIAFYKEINSSPLDVHVWQENNKFDSVAGPTRDGTDTGWDMFKQLSGTTVSAFPEADKAASRFAFPQSSPDLADIAYQKVVANVGAFPWNRSATDNRLIGNVTDYTGVAPLSAPDATEWNNLVTMSQPANWVSRPAGWDTDQDGMPNYWESLRGLNPSANDGTIVTASGYTNLENYLNSLTFIANWNLNANGDWSGILNWRGELPNSSYATANFKSGITAPRTIAVDVPVTVSDMNFDSAQGYTLAGNAPITFDALSGFATVNVNTGSHTISAPVTLSDSVIVAVNAGANLNFTSTFTATGKAINKDGAGTAQFENVRAAGLNVLNGNVAIRPKGAPNSAAGTSIVNLLAIAPGASLDLNDNALVIDYSTLGTLLSDTRQKLHDGLIKTSLSGGGHALGYADNAGLNRGAVGGQDVDATSLLIAYTFSGDSNLDGSVNALDFNAVAANFGGVSDKVWVQGDFNYDGTVNSLDFNALAANFGSTMPLPGAGLGAIVPEPGMLGALCGLFGTASFRGQRKRRSGRCENAN
jgi:hypothetical protein